MYSSVGAIQRDDDIALFAPRFDIAMGFDNLFQRIAAINDRRQFSGFVCAEGESSLSRISTVVK